MLFLSHCCSEASMWHMWLIRASMLIWWNFLKMSQKQSGVAWISLKFIFIFPLTFKKSETKLFHFKIKCFFLMKSRVSKVQNMPTWFLNPLSPSLIPSDSFSLAGAPLGVWRRMERGGESPVAQGSPERMGGSPELSGLPPPGKKSRLELNGSPTGPRTRHNGAPPRPLGGNHQAHRKIHKSGFYSI